MRQIIRYSMDMETWGLPGTFPRGVAAQTMPRIVANTTDRVLADRKSFFPNISMSRGDAEAAADEERAEAMKPSPKSRAISWNYVGYACIAAAVLHFSFPDVLLF